MALPVVYQILNAIATRLPSITVANGYNFDVGENGKGFKSFAEINDGNFPAVFVSDAVETRRIFARIYEVRLDVFLYGWVRSEDRRLDVRKLAQDIERMIYADETWGGLAERTDVIGDQTDRSIFFSEPIGYLEMHIQPIFSIERGLT